MADVEGSFELAKLQWRFARAPAGGVTEDVAVMTFHFLKTAAPTAPWTSTEAQGCEDELDALWSAIASYMNVDTTSDQYRWYHDGPAYYELRPEEDPYRYLPIGDNPAFRVTEVNGLGTGSTNPLPPQLAISVTEKTSRRGSWGRVYLPNPIVDANDTEGRLNAVVGAALVGAFGTAYGNLKAAGTPVVVWSIQKPERPKKNGNMLAPEPARALEITSLVIDNVFDVIRSRRWDTPTQRFTATL